MVDAHKAEVTVADVQVAEEGPLADLSSVMDAAARRVLPVISLITLIEV